MDGAWTVPSDINGRWTIISENRPSQKCSVCGCGCVCSEIASLHNSILIRGSMPWHKILYVPVYEVQPSIKHFMFFFFFFSTSCLRIPVEDQEYSAKSSRNSLHFPGYFTWKLRGPSPPQRFVLKYFSTSVRVRHSFTPLHGTNNASTLYEITISLTILFDGLPRWRQ